MQKLILLLIFCVIFVNCDVIRLKRSPQDSFLTRAKSKIANFGSDVKNFAVKGYEETKNLFSKDRKVGDYTLDKIDVRFGEDGEEETTTFGSPNEIRVKRETDDDEQLMEEIRELLENDKNAESSKISSSTLPNNAEVSPGYPIQYSIIIAPLKCKQGFGIVGSDCRQLV